MTVEYEKIVKRTVYIAECNCGSEDKFQRVWDSNPPREVTCPKCGTWLAIREQTAISPEYKMLNE